MPEAQSVKHSPTDATHKSFFRQSGWLMIAGIAGGVLMWATHFLSRVIGPKEYGLFGVLLAVITIIPSMPVQMVIAHQTAQALAGRRERELAGIIRFVLRITFLLWLGLAFVVLAMRQQLIDSWEITDPAGIWITLVGVLLYLWMPVFWGVLQGQQNVLWWGWTMVLNGAGRLVVGAAAVGLLVKLSRPNSYAAGMMLGVVVGLGVAVAIAAWQTRSLWTTASLPVDWKSLIRQALPLLCGFGCFQFLLTADTVFVKGWFSSDEAGFYVSAGTLSRALMWLVGPLASVMFPRIVHSAARGERGDLMWTVLAGTAILAVGGAMGLSVLGPYVVRLVSGQKFVAMASSLLPLYAFDMVPLCLANVLLNNLLARSSFKLVIPLLFLVISYALALTQLHGSLVTVLKTLGAFNLGLLSICAWFTWRDKAAPIHDSSIQR